MIMINDYVTFTQIAFRMASVRVCVWVGKPIYL